MTLLLFKCALQAAENWLLRRVRGYSLQVNDTLMLVPLYNAEKIPVGIL
jgi:hypothetical protein